MACTFCDGYQKQGYRYCPKCGAKLNPTYTSKINYFCGNSGCLDAAFPPDKYTLKIHEIAEETKRRKDLPFDSSTFGRWVASSFNGIGKKAFCPRCGGESSECYGYQPLST